LVYLKLRCPTIDLKNSLKNVEKFLKEESPRKRLAEESTD